MNKKDITIHLGTDHAGFELKSIVEEYLLAHEYEVVDHGAFDFNKDDDYPDFVKPVAQAVSADPEKNWGVILGGSGQGEAICANRFPNVRAVVFNGQYAPADGRKVPSEVETAREHNDANVLSLGARFLSHDDAREAVQTFLETKFSGDKRHIQRLKKIDESYG